MGSPRGFRTDLPMQFSGIQMNRRAPGTPQTCSFFYTSGHSTDKIQQDQVDYSFSPYMSVPLMNRMAPANPPSHLYNYKHVDDSRMNVRPQSAAGPTTWKKHQKRTSFMQMQHEQLEALFSYTMFPDKNLQKELALKLNLPETTIKTWFRNRRVKLRKQQQQLSPKQPNQILPAKIMPASPTTSTNPYSFYPAVSGFCSSLQLQPVGPYTLAWNSVITESPIGGDQMQDPQLERLAASVPALYSDAYDIEQIMEIYSFPDEEETPGTSFQCLYQYLSPTDSS